MFRKMLWPTLIGLILAMAPFAYAGKVELTTYYPAPYGEYKELKTTENASFATAGGSVIVGTDSLTDPAVDNTLTLKKVSGNAGAQTGGTEGSLRYSKDAGGSNVGGLLYKNGSGWQNFGNAKIASNSVYVSAPSTDVKTTTHILFPSGTFTSAPIVLVQLNAKNGPSADGWRFLDTEWGATPKHVWTWVWNITKDGFDFSVKTNYSHPLADWYCEYIAVGQ